MTTPSAATPGPGNRDGVHAINVEGSGVLLSVIMPVYNEAPRVRKVLEAVRAVDLPKEIVAVDDGSRDGTYEILVEEAARDPSLRVIHHTVNQGKGAAVRTGRQHVTGKVVIIQDGDLEYDPKDYPALIKPIVDGKARVVFGSRFRGRNENMHPLNWIANKFLTLETNVLYRSGITDACTAYKAMDAELFKNIYLETNGFEFCHELAVRLASDRIRIHEVPISYRARRSEDGKKVGWRQLFISTWTLLRLRFQKTPVQSAQKK
jgi:glycosyltransferase involved in cell wall biosynthesis